MLKKKNSQLCSLRPVDTLTVHPPLQNRSLWDYRLLNLVSCRATEKSMYNIGHNLELTCVTCMGLPLMSSEEQHKWNKTFIYSSRLLTCIAVGWPFLLSLLKNSCEEKLESFSEEVVAEVARAKSKWPSDIFIYSYIKTSDTSYFKNSPSWTTWTNFLPAPVSLSNSISHSSSILHRVSDLYQCSQIHPVSSSHSI